MRVQSWCMGLQDAVKLEDAQFHVRHLHQKAVLGQIDSRERPGRHDAGHPLVAQVSEWSSGRKWVIGVAVLVWMPYLSEGRPVELRTSGCQSMRMLSPECSPIMAVITQNT